MEYLETRAVLLALENDDAALRLLLGEMLPGERRTLENACRKIIQTIVWDELEARTTNDSP